MDNQIFEEIEEELKTEKAVEFLKKYYKYVLAAFIGVALIIVIYMNYISNRDSQMCMYSDKLVESMLSKTSGRKTQREIDWIVEKAPKKIREIANIIKLSNEQNIDELLKVYLDVSYEVYLRDFAALCYLNLALDKISEDESTKILDALIQKERPFRFMALELKGNLLVNRGDINKARQTFEIILNDVEAKKIPGLYNRVRLINDSLDL